MTTIQLPLKDSQKLTVVCRVESGCLGPEGASHIEKFCRFAQPRAAQLDKDFVIWELTPRHDKTLSEMHYKIGDKTLDHLKAEKYLNLFNKSLDEFESHIHDLLADLIDEYMGQ